MRFTPQICQSDYQFRKGDYEAEASQIGPRQFILQVQGPNSLFVLEKATGESLRDIGFMRFRDTQIGNVRFKVLRQGMAGEIGYELHGPMEHAQEIFNILLEHGRHYGIRRLGGRTKMVNHVEACFPTASVDYVPALFGEEEKEFTAAYFSPNAQSIQTLAPFIGRRSNSGGVRTSNSITTSSGGRRSNRRLPIRSGRW